MAVAAPTAAGPAPGWTHPRTVLPPGARDELARRRELLLARARGRVLDLDEPGVAARFAPVGRTGLVAAGAAAEGTTPPAPDQRYDTVVATGVLAAFADLGAVAAALAALVADDGDLLVVEPVARPGWIPLLRTSLPGPGSRAGWRRLHLDRDVPAAIRAAGLVICDLDRIVVPHQPPSLRHWISARAVRIIPTPAG